MTTVKTIRNVNEETWRELKTLAAKRRVPLGTLLKNMITEYKKETNNAWDAILNTEKIISDEEAEDLEEITKGMRKEKGWRT
ncbi:hypothetical protein CMI48_01030 [Candidatus Pacearchaeota archaeon]|nr:hypothetical protein [Candidatus Pacearchaeota archaeon]